MAYITAEARQELLDDVAAAIAQLEAALAVLGELYEDLDEHSADTLEAQLFRPVQLAFGRVRRTHTDFAARHGLAARPSNLQAPASASGPAAERLDRAVDAVVEADAVLAELQDSMRPVEVGDPELRAGLAEVRRLLDPVGGRARQIQRLLGR